jgi:hypothetical protein
LLALVATVSPAQASNAVYPPGLEGRVGDLVFRGDGPPLADAVEVLGAHIEGDRIEVELGEQTRGRPTRCAARRLGAFCCSPSGG